MTLWLRIEKRQGKGKKDGEEMKDRFCTQSQTKPEADRTRESLTGSLVNKSLSGRLLISVAVRGKEQISGRASGPDICNGRESCPLTSKLSYEGKAELSDVFEAFPKFPCPEACMCLCWARAPDGI